MAADIWGSVGGPKWLDPDEHRAIIKGAAARDAAPFTQGFISAFTRAQDEKYRREDIEEQRRWLEDERNKTIEELRPIFGNPAPTTPNPTPNGTEEGEGGSTSAPAWTQGANPPVSSTDFLSRIEQNPWLMVNPRTSKFVQGAAQTWAEVERAKNVAANSKIAVQNQERNTSWDGLFGTMPPEVQKDILENGGMFIVDQSTGLRHPNPVAVQRYNQWAVTTEDRIPFGLGPTEQKGFLANRKAQADAKRAKDAADAAAKRQEEALKARAAAPASPLGKLYSDLEKSKAAGAPDEVLKGYQTAIDRESGGKPQTITLDNGQQALWVPGHGAHILKNPTTEAKAAMAKKRFDDAEAKLLAAEKNIMQGYTISQEAMNKIKTERNAAERDWLNLYRSASVPVAPAPVVAPGATTAPSDNRDPLGLFK